MCLHQLAICFGAKLLFNLSIFSKTIAWHDRCLMDKCFKCVIGGFVIILAT